MADKAIAINTLYTPNITGAYPSVGITVLYNDGEILVNHLTLEEWSKVTSISFP